MTTIPSDDDKQQLDESAERVLQQRPDLEDKSMDEKLRQSQKARCEYLLKLNDLGIAESAALEITQEGIIPRIQIKPLSPEAAAADRKNIEATLARLTGIVVPSSKLTL